MDLTREINMIPLVCTVHIKYFGGEHNKQTITVWIVQLKKDLKLPKVFIASLTFKYFEQFWTQTGVRIIMLHTLS